VSDINVKKIINANTHERYNVLIKINAKDFTVAELKELCNKFIGKYPNGNKQFLKNRLLNHFYEINLWKGMDERYSGKRKVVFNIYCCQRMQEFCESMSGLSLPIGESETSGSICLDEKLDGAKELSIEDGWNFIPSLVMNYCPYCGIKLVKLNECKTENK